MGMFDYVNVSMPCPSCGKEHKSFQSKDEGCNLELIEPDSLGRFYSYCQCGVWIKFSRPRPEQLPTRERPRTRKEVEAMGFVLSVTKPKTPNARLTAPDTAQRTDDEQH